MSAESVITIRDFRKSDIPTLKVIQDRNFPIKYSDDFYDRIGSGNKARIGFVAVENDDIVGFVSFLTYSTPFLKKRVGYITTLVVPEEHRRRGIASLLLNRLVEICKTRQCVEISLHCLATNTPAIAMYKKNGYNFQRTVKDYYTFGDAIILKKELIAQKGVIGEGLSWFEKVKRFIRDDVCLMHPSASK
eukprot:TRINITY_DN776036_c0_g1_i1.p1 TRINITY_DN776036_c0_g1~~TRINITY_DN776036_c0_g1_i1.p1  ORF type:complete len:190 (+),score=21.87 TRINITY_DN776036_c0_g1_i1:68-637(+)